MSTWTVLVSDGDRWATEHEGTRFVTAARVFAAAPSPKRFLRDGRPLPVLAGHDQLDLFNETS